MASQYTPLADPYAAFAQAMKHINQAINGAFVLARLADHLALDNSSLRYKVEEEDAAKARSVERVQLEVEKDALRIEKEALQLRYKELERAKAHEAVKASEALAQVKRDAETALVSAATKADADRINFVNSTLLYFLSSPAYEKKVGHECVAYLHSLVCSHS
ncbi:hypothetical protein LIER_26074 [Lithospermum erythrorhizon]|uniref:Uncharacterized protein n=1 Tax=Lithospermum erythrorhizon TaxID=34254 RepID=A0AAV3R748_LITER